MDALNFKIKFLSLCLLLSACANNDGIDQNAKKEVLANNMLFSVKQQCLPNEVIDEEDLPLLARQGYTVVNNQYCLPPQNNNDGNDTVSNCIRDMFIDETDLAYLLAHGYVPGTNSDYCLVIGGGSTSGGSTTGGSSSGGSTSGGTVTGGTVSGGTVSGGSTSDGSTSGGSSSGGSTSGGTVTGGTVTGGTVSGGTVSGGSTSDGSTSGGSSSGGSTSGGTVTGGTVSGGTVSGGSTSGGETSGGSSSGGSCHHGNNGHGNDRDHNDSSNPGHSNNGDGTDDDGQPGHHGQQCPPEDPKGCEMNLIPGINNEAYFDKCKPWSVDVDRMCSRMRTGSGRYKLRDRLELVLQVVKRVKTYKEVEVCKEQVKLFDFSSHDFGKGHEHNRSCQHKDVKVVCKVEKKEILNYVPICESRDTDKIKRDIMEKKTLDFSACDMESQDKKDIYVTLFSPVVSSDLPISSVDYENVRFFKNNSQERGKDVLSFILYGSRDLRYASIREKIVVITDDNPDFNSHVNKKDCDMRASPLIVHVNPQRDVARYVELSKIEDGVNFNILGYNAEPRANAPKQISWLTSDQYMFLVKPNNKGRVDGVDQMFGDNTRGPDKDFAANGFIALAKFDNNADGIINQKDEVFKALRLWKDKNRDGIGTPDELYSLESMSVKAIDLSYDSSFRERDAYGNETLYKSVIQYNDGSLDLVFDLWFNYKK